MIGMKSRSWNVGHSPYLAEMQGLHGVLTPRRQCAPPRPYYAVFSTILCTFQRRMVGKSVEGPHSEVLALHTGARVLESRLTARLSPMLVLTLHLYGCLSKQSGLPVRLK